MSPEEKTARGRWWNEYAKRLKFFGGKGILYPKPKVDDKEKKDERQPTTGK
jgi:hypothetical protein